MGLIKFIVTGQSQADRERRQRQRAAYEQEAAEADRMAKVHRHTEAQLRKKLASGRSDDPEADRYFADQQEIHARTHEHNARVTRSFL